MATEDETVAKTGGGIFTKEAEPSTHMGGDSTEIIKEAPPGHPWRRQNLVLQIPSRTLEDAKGDFVRINLPPTPSPTATRKGEAQRPIRRSCSVPVIGSVIRVIPTTPQVAERTVSMTSSTSPINDTDGSDDGGEDIAEEEAVCRICLVELGEDADTLKMECSCKGDLALAHQKCAVKWFSIKGNKKCDVCGEEVQNLPVTLLRIQNSQAVNFRTSRGQQAEVTQYRVCQDVPILAIVSMFAYFCSLEQLLVGKMGSGAIALSLPFSCILGLLASMTSTTMVRRRYVWIYATTQFALVVLAAHLLYSLIHMQAVLALLLATFSGFGITMCGSYIIVEALRWRGRWRSQQSNQQHGSQEVTQPNQSQQNAQQTQTNPQLRENEVEGAEVTHGSTFACTNTTAAY